MLHPVLAANACFTWIPPLRHCLFHLPTASPFLPFHSSLSHCRLPSIHVSVKLAHSVFQLSIFTTSNSSAPCFHLFTLFVHQHRAFTTYLSISSPYLSFKHHFFTIRIYHTVYKPPSSLPHSHSPSPHTTTSLELRSAGGDTMRIKCTVGRLS